MGNSLRKPDTKDTVVYGGKARSLVPASHDSPVDGSHLKESRAYDPEKVSRLILCNKLAPFYEGKFDEQSSGKTEQQSQIPLDRDGDAAANPTLYARKKNRSAGSNKKKKAKRRSTDLNWLSDAVAECGVCFLVRNIVN
jgi:hypothetical protein